MKVIWLGHGSFRLEIDGQILLIDPWITGNPVFPEDRRAEAIADVDHILLTHAHSDHVADCRQIAQETGATLVGQYDLMGFWAEHEGLTTIGFNKGGTVQLGRVAVTMVHAVHSTSFRGETGPIVPGTECGFMISGEGRTIYVTGDTDVMADMEIFNDLHAPDIGILCAGGHFTMDMKRAAYAAKKFFDFKVVIPCHYKTFPLLEQSAEVLASGLPGVEVIEPEVMTAIAL